MPSRIYDNLNLIKLSVGSSHSAGITPDGKIVGWGSASKGKLDFDKMDDASDIDCAYAHTVFINEGVARTCGNDRFGRCDTATLGILHPIGVRASKFHTAVLNSGVDKYEISVFGDQSNYSSVPAHYYTKITKNHGVFRFDGITEHFDICDDGTLLVADRKKNVVHAFKDIRQEFEYSGNISFLQASDGICVTVIDGKANCLVWGETDRNLPVSFDDETCKFAFCGKNYIGLVRHDNTFLLKGDHFGSVKLPDGWDIKKLVSGDNGYAMNVSDNVGGNHLVLVGNNTVNKELVIPDQSFRECPRDKSSSTEDHPIYNVKSLVVKNFSQVVAAPVETVTEASAHECVSCNFKFVSSSAVCPICGGDTDG